MNPMLALRHCLQGAILMVVIHMRACARDPSLIFFSTAGDDEHSAGFYGGRLNGTSDVVASDLFEFGYNCLQYGEEDGLTELPLTSVSIDPITHKILLYVKEERKITLTTGHLCAKEQNQCSNSTVEVLFYRLSSHHEKVGPFAYYNSEIYFILFKRNMVNMARNRGVIQLRKLEGCKESYPAVTTGSFDLRQCSKVISNMSVEEFQHFAHLMPLDHLVARPSPDGVTPEFFLQMWNISYDDNEHKTGAETVLFHVTTGHHSRVTALHHQKVDVIFTSWEMFFLGGISLKDNLLCWSSVDIVHCGTFEDGQLDNIRTVIPRGEASRVCTGYGAQTLLANVTTGLAIAHTEPISIYFGCMSHVSSTPIGGAGLVQMLHKNGKAQPRMRRLVSGASPIYAGSIFLHDQCHSSINPYSMEVSNTAPDDTLHVIILLLTSVLLLVVT